MMKSPLQLVTYLLMAVTFGLLSQQNLAAAETSKNGAPSESLQVLADYPALPQPQEMMRDYLSKQIDEAAARWRDDYEQRKSPEQIAEYQKRLKETFTERIGGFPERTPLNPQVVGKLERRGYRIEKILFESQPKHFVSAALFLPDAEKFKPPYAGVLMVCGHSNDGKACDAYAPFGALAAVNGLAVLIVDPIDQGERHQWIDADGKYTLACCAGHNMIGVGSILLGRNTARFEIYDGMRGIDYLQSRDDIDPERIGCVGNSGGGTQTAYIMALDDRVKAAAPSCYICSLYGRMSPQDAEQNIFGQLAFGMDHADYCMMRAPRPTLLCTATRDFFSIEAAWASFRYAKRLYGRLGYGDRMSLVETDQPHGFTLRLREAAARWLVRWLDGRDEAIFEPEDLDVPSKADLQCTPDGEVMRLEGARSVYDLNRDYGYELAKKRKQLWEKTPREEMLHRVAQIAGIRPLAELPELKAESRGTVQRPGYRIEKLVLMPEEEISLPALYFVPEGKSTGAIVYIHEDGKSADAATGGPIETLVKQGKAVLAVDLRGTGETQRLGQKYFNPTLHGPDGCDYYLAYHLGRSYVGMRTEDLLVCARWLAEKKHGGTDRVDLVSVGYLGSSALHAAALEPQLFDAVRLVRSLVSWANVVELGFSKNRLVNTVHGALTQYDLPDLARVVGQSLAIEDARDAMGQ